MTAGTCPFPATCPVPTPGVGVDARRVRLSTVDAGTTFYRVYELKYGYDAFNPGLGDTRFAPFGAAGTPVPTLYGGADEETVLLETVFHDVHHAVGSRVIRERDLLNRGLAFLSSETALRLVDLRDEALTDLGLDRHQVVSTTAAHYPCTREWAVWCHARRPGGRPPAGIVWNSRQAELRGGPPREVFVLFGDRVPTAPGTFPLVYPGVRNLTEGPGRLLVDRLAVELDALVDPLA